MFAATQPLLRSIERPLSQKPPVRNFRCIKINLFTYLAVDNVVDHLKQLLIDIDLGK